MQKPFMGAAAQTQDDKRRQHASRQPKPGNLLRRYKLAREAGLPWVDLSKE